MIGLVYWLLRLSPYGSLIDSALSVCYFYFSCCLLEANSIKSSSISPISISKAWSPLSWIPLFSYQSKYNSRISILILLVRSRCYNLMNFLISSIINDFFWLLIIFCYFDTDWYFFRLWVPSCDFPSTNIEYIERLLNVELRHDYLIAYDSQNLSRIYSIILKIIGE